MLRTKTLLFTLIAVIPVAAAAANNNVVGLKGIYVDRAQHPTTLGVRFHIQLDRDGKRVNVPASYEFHTGDRFWLQVETRTGAYVYVINRTVGGSDKGLDVVREEDANRTPPPSEMPHLVFGPERVEAGKFRGVPKQSAMVFDVAPGIEKLYVIISPERIPELEQDFTSQGDVSHDGKGIALRNLDKSLTGWAKNARQAVPVASKGVVLDDPDGYAMQEGSVGPILAEITLRHNR